MSVLTTRQRKSLPPTAFGVAPNANALGRFPMPDAAHAANAKSRVVHAKGLTAAQRKHIVAKASTILGGK
jgi:hypothetical protein